MESFEIDDSTQGLLDPGYSTPTHHHERVRDYAFHRCCRVFYVELQRAQPVASTLLLLARPIISLLAVPIHILANIVRFVFGLLRIPVPQFHLRFVGINLYRSLGSSRSTLGQTNGGPERWIRELEEETGAVCIRKMGNIGTSSPGAASSAIDAGPSNLTARGAGMTPPVDLLLEDGRKVLPDFMLGSYEDMLRTCKKEARIGCAILVSEEHDDVPAFKRYALRNLCTWEVAHCCQVHFDRPNFCEAAI